MRKIVIALSFLLFLPCSVSAVEIAGVAVAPAVSAGGKTLQLNGAGVRKKFFFTIYVGALYTERKASSAGQLLADPGEKLVRMTFVYKRVEKEKIVETFAEGLANNSPDTARSAEAKAFLSWFTADFVAGDTVDISLSPDGTVAAAHNGKVLGTARSPSLARAVLRIWFGDKPGDAGLMKGMLGQK